MKCTKCSLDNQIGAKYCEECGTKLMLICSACNKEIQMNDTFCGECGATVKPIDDTKVPMQREIQAGRLPAQRKTNTAKKTSDNYEDLRTKPKVLVDAINSGKIRDVVDNEFVRNTLRWFRISDVRLRIPVYLFWGLLSGIVMTLVTEKPQFPTTITLCIYAYCIGAAGGPLKWIVDKLQHIPLSWIVIVPFITLPWYCFGWPAEKMYEFIFWRFTCLNMGAAYIQQGEHEKARIELENAKVPKGDKEGKLLQYALLGDANSELGRYDDAISAYTKAIEYDPEDTGLKLDLAYCHIMKDNSKEALGLLLDALKSDQENTNIYLGIARCYLIEEKYNQAIRYLQQLIELDEESAIGHKMLAEAYMGLGEEGQALKEAQLALTLDPAPNIADGAQEIIDYIQDDPASEEYDSNENGKAVSYSNNIMQDPSSMPINIEGTENIKAEDAKYRGTTDDQNSPNNISEIICEYKSANPIPNNIATAIATVSGTDALLKAHLVLESDSKIKYELAHALLIKALKSGLLSKKQEFDAYFALVDIYLAEDGIVDMDKGGYCLKKGISIANELELDYDEDWKLVSRKEALWILLDVFSDRCIKNNNWERAFEYYNEAITYTDHPAAHLKIADIYISRKHDVESARKHLGFIIAPGAAEYFRTVFQGYDEIATQASLEINKLPSGTVLVGSSASMLCANANCRKELSMDSLFCGYCGTKAVPT